PRSDYPAYYDRVRAACQAAGFVPRVSHREAQQNCAVLVAAGNGILLTPATFGRNPTPGMRYVPLESAESEGLQAEVWAAWPRVDAHSAAAETLRTIVRSLASTRGQEYP
ncbi:MAG: hypothetical protein H7Z41_12500, partial [Cytophagales bacterium]|nr:hypothetical protein [Armatimonadota bacterium]